jgi:hypothetical protein
MAIINTLIPSIDKDPNAFNIGTISADGNYQVVEEYIGGRVRHKWENTNASAGSGSGSGSGVTGIKLSDGTIVNPDGAGLITLPPTAPTGGTLTGALTGTKLVLSVGKTPLEVDLASLVPTATGNCFIKSGVYDVAKQSIEIVTEDGKTVTISLTEAIAKAAASAVKSGAIVGNNLELTTGDGKKITIDVTSLLADIKLKTATYDAGTKNLNLTLTDNSVISVPIGDVLGSTLKTTTTLEGDGVTTPLKVGISTDVDNLVKLGTDGKLYANLAKTDTYLKAVTYNKDTRELKLVLTNNTEYNVTLDNLVTEDTPLPVAKVILSKTPDNLLQYKIDSDGIEGLYVSPFLTIRGSFSSPLTTNLTLEPKDRVVLVKSGSNFTMTRLPEGKMVTIKNIGEGTLTLNGSFNQLPVIDPVTGKIKHNPTTFVHEMPAPNTFTINANQAVTFISDQNTWIDTNKTV